MPASILLTVRAATPADRHSVLALIQRESLVHQHLDWRPSDAWIGSSPFFLAEAGGRVAGCLACPPDPPNTAWVRLFTVANGPSLGPVWRSLWPVAFDVLRETEAEVVAAVQIHDWLGDLLRGSGFTPTHDVVVLARSNGTLPPAPIIQARIRSLRLDDLPAVTDVDNAAFRPPWQQSLNSLRTAYLQAEISTVAELDGRVVGYQISTATRSGGHLGRLAVLPETQGMGIGRALTHSALAHFERRRTRLVSVNTQNDNAASLAVYRSLGFEPTGEAFPVHQLRIRESRDRRPA